MKPPLEEKPQPQGAVLSDEFLSQAAPEPGANNAVPLGSTAGAGRSCPHRSGVGGNSLYMCTLLRPK